MEGTPILTPRSGPDHLLEQRISYVIPLLYCHLTPCAPPQVPQHLCLYHHHPHWSRSVQLFQGRTLLAGRPADLWHHRLSYLGRPWQDLLPIKPMLHMRPRSKHLGWVQEDLLQIALIPPLRPQSGGAQQDLHLITLVPPPVAVRGGCLPME